MSQRGVGKDSAEVVNFMTLFARLKAFSDDMPDDLIDFSDRDSSVRVLCLELGDAAHLLTMNESRARILFAAPVDPTFISAWRDYEVRYARAVSTVWIKHVLPELDEPRR